MIHECPECKRIFSKTKLLSDNSDKADYCRLDFWDKVRRGALLLRFQDKAFYLGKYIISDMAEHQDFYMFECQRCRFVSVGYIHKGGCPYFLCDNCNRKAYLDITIKDIFIGLLKFLINPKNSN